VASLSAEATSVGWVAPVFINTTAHPDAHPVPWMGVAEYMGIDEREATEHLAAAIWSLVHPNVVADPQVSETCCCQLSVVSCQLSVVGASRCTHKGLARALSFASLNNR
jgi:hypothetical protein